MVTKKNEQTTTATATATDTAPPGSREYNLIDLEAKDLAGLAKARPWLAGAMAAFMFSLAGVPPLAGFFAKFYAFAGAVNSGYTGLVVLAVIMSAVSMYYYLKVTVVMYMKPAASEQVYEAPGLAEAVIALMAAGVLLNALCIAVALSGVDLMQFLVALFAFGEGLQNNHHAFPNAAYHGFRWWEPDISALFIRLLRITGLIWKVRLATPEIRGQALQADRGIVFVGLSRVEAATVAENPIQRTA